MNIQKTVQSLQKKQKSNARNKKNKQYTLIILIPQCAQVHTLKHAVE